MSKIYASWKDYPMSQWRWPGHAVSTANIWILADPTMIEDQYPA